jgi:signal transduction histidine kinase
MRAKAIDGVQVVDGVTLSSAYVQGIAPILEQAVRMVSDNALEAMPSEGLLTYRLRMEDDFVVLDIVDTGVGMSEAVRDACVEPLFTTKETGSGLGLAVTQAAVNWHHGELKINSQPGQGTTVSLWFPAEG